MAHGRVFDERLQYAVGGFDGHLTGLADNNTTRDAVGYLNLKPFLTSERYPLLRDLNLGVSGFLGRQVSPVEPLPLRTSLQSSDNDEAARSASSIFLDYRDDAAAFGGRSASAAHLACYGAGFSFEAEIQGSRDHFIRKGLNSTVSVPVRGGHATLSYFVTGEKVRGRTMVTPLRPFDPVRNSWGPGAIELFARYSHLSVGETVFSAGIAKPDEWTREISLTDIGLNWYLTRYIKIYFDWQHSAYGSPVLLNPAKDLYSLTNDLFWIRGQLQSGLPAEWDIPKAPSDVVAAPPAPSLGIVLPLIVLTIGPDRVDPQLTVLEAEVKSSSRIRILRRRGQDGLVDPIGRRGPASFLASMTLGGDQDGRRSQLGVVSTDGSVHARDGGRHEDRKARGIRRQRTPADLGELSFPGSPERGPLRHGPRRDRNGLVHDLQGDCLLVVEHEPAPGGDGRRQISAGIPGAILGEGRERHLPRADPANQLDEHGSLASQGLPLQRLGQLVEEQELNALERRVGRLALCQDSPHGSRCGDPDGHTHQHGDRGRLIADRPAHVEECPA